MLSDILGHPAVLLSLLSSYAGGIYAVKVFKHIVSRHYFLECDIHNYFYLIYQSIITPNIIQLY